MRLMLAVVWIAASAAAGAVDDYAFIKGGEFETALKYEDTSGTVRVPPFRMMTRPVTNAEFLAFVKLHAQWQRGRVATVFANDGYLAHWASAMRVDASQSLQPVTRVSWYAAAAYCEAQGARLPRWVEWEYVAAADATRRDARRDPKWREQILAWYSRPSSSALPAVDTEAPNVYGVRALHGVVWEWVDDVGAMLVDADNRNQGDAGAYAFFVLAGYFGYAGR